MHSLTIKVISSLYGTKHLSVMAPLPKENLEFQSFIKDLPNDGAVQCWFRMLHTLGNPTDLLYSNLITNTPDFMKFIQSSETTPSSDAVQKCIGQLPLIFESLMKGVSLQVNLFLGRSVATVETQPKVSQPLVRSSPSVRRKDPLVKSTFYIPSPQPSQRTVMGGANDSFYVNIGSLSRTPTTPTGNSANESTLTLDGIIGKPKGTIYFIKIQCYSSKILRDQFTHCLNWFVIQYCLCTYIWNKSSFYLQTSM